MQPLLVCIFIVMFFSYPSFISILSWLRVNHTPYLGQIQERKILEISRLNQSSWPIIDFYTLSQISRRQLPYFTKTPQHRGLVIFYGPPRMYRIYCIYCTTVFYFFIRIFFSRFTAILLEQSISYTFQLDELLCQRIICTEFRQTYFFSSFFLQYICIERHD